MNTQKLDYVDSNVVKSIRQKQLAISESNALRLILVGHHALLTRTTILLPLLRQCALQQDQDLRSFQFSRSLCSSLLCPISAFYILLSTDKFKRLSFLRCPRHALLRLLSVSNRQKMQENISLKYVEQLCRQMSKVYVSTIIRPRYWRVQSKYQSTNLCGWSHVSVAFFYNRLLMLCIAVVPSC